MQARRRRRFHRRKPKHALNDQKASELQPVENHQLMVSAILNCRLVTWLRNSALGLWLSERATELRNCRVVNTAVSWLNSSPWTMPLLLVLQAVLWLLLLWVLAELHLGLPCVLLALLYWIYNEPVKKAVDQAWAHWRDNRPVRADQSGS
ncbi:hypothetical protein AMEX_G17240 [Astyanax mexicanus]|uniref:Uncharacterized protein n=1 Tax=Astyanax mexicanus TaxID=7994 RepID=A0A8T2LHB8_ASTMX|nr:hypothetical protein AMEX_G17240 [Astyanax mexicanus]